MSLNLSGPASRRAALVTIALSLCAVTAALAEPARSCAPAGPLRPVPELVEGSGIAASHLTPGRFWAHNDSGDPVLFALDGDGRVTGRIRLAGAVVEDWEAVAVGPCQAGSCIYVGDIGDNDATRDRITIYRVNEPAEADGTVSADAIHATYPDGPHDAEALILDRQGRLLVITKGDTGPVALYRFPGSPEAGSTVRLERVGPPRSGGRPARGDRITDAAMSADGEWIALRSTTALTLHRTSDLVAGNWREASRVALTTLGEPQGEGVTFAGNDAVYLVSEGGGKSRPGTFARLACR